MKIPVIYPDITFLSEIPDHIKGRESIFQYIFDFEGIKNGDMIIYRSQFYLFDEGWKKIDDMVAAEIQVSRRGFGETVIKKQ